MNYRYHFIRDLVPVGFLAGSSGGVRGDGSMLTFEWLEPSSMQEAISILKNSKNPVLYAGGTDLVPLMKYGLRKPDVCVSLKHIPGLNQVETNGEYVKIGSMVTLTSLAHHPSVNRLFPSVGKAANLVASPQIRNIGTLGGNILQERRCKYFNRSDRWRKDLKDCYLIGGDHCFQAPRSRDCRALYYSDVAAPLIAYNARLELYGENGPSTVSLSQIFSDNGSINLDKNAVVTGLILPAPSPGTRSLFLKKSVRGSLDFPLATVAIAYTPGDDAGEPTIAIVVGAMAPSPLRLRDTEKHIRNLGRIETGNLEEVISKATGELAQKSRLIHEADISIRAKKAIAAGLLGKVLNQILLER